MGFFKTIKDDSVSFIAKQTINAKISRYGEIDDFQIDSDNHRILMKIILKGEVEPILLTINRYELINIDEKDYLLIREISSSREWINLAAEDFLIDKEFEIPEKFSRIFKIIME